MAFGKAPRMTQDNHAHTRSFRVYSDCEKTDQACSMVTAQKSGIPVRSRRKSVRTSTGSTSSTKNMKKEIHGIKVKGKSHCDSSEDTKVRRKALADLSNVASNTSRSKALGDSITMKHKRVKSAILQRMSVGSFKVQDTSSRKSTEGKVRGKPTQVFGDRQIYRTEAGDRSHQLIKSKNLSLASATDATRKSFPSLKRTSLTNKSSLKKDNRSSFEAKGLCEASKVSKKVIPQGSSARSNLLKNRTSDGFVQSCGNSRRKNIVHPIQRKSTMIQMAVKTTLQTSQSQKKPKCLVVRSKSRSISSLSSKEAVSGSSHHEKVPEKVELEAPVENTQLECSATSTQDVTVRPKSKRRRSFTSLLVTRSKDTGEDGHNSANQKLPKIDDESNQLEVAEYVDDIYQFYWVAEAQNPPLGNYMAIQSEITPHMRGVLINWLVEVHFKFDLMAETLYLTVNLLDRYLSQVPIKKTEMQLIGLTALLLASKYEDFWHPRIKDLIGISAESYTREQILGMERIMLKQLKFRLNAPTSYVFMLRFLKAAQSNQKLEQLAFYLIELSLVEYDALKYKPSMLCASAIYVARCTLRMAPSWTPLLIKHARYDVPEMRDCAEMILRSHKAAKTGKLRVTYEKYMNPDRFNVAVLKPLDKLSQL
ncbi:PREDICTED: putative cyclin-B3-1 [Tarenaya hassleriana]|uniref:putative cyclin-B3-1 n=1 Tax=Tarenaya hassleriana TaxID=28532 RepID=UPI00053C7A03|nr:PREDICTED: putative cyclin-B3-1 [Tarenaya hassleriana]